MNSYNSIILLLALLLRSGSVPVSTAAITASPKHPYLINPQEIPASEYALITGKQPNFFQSQNPESDILHPSGVAQSWLPPSFSAYQTILTM